MNLNLLHEELSKMVRVDQKDIKTFSENVKIIKLNKKEKWENSGNISQNMGFVNSGLLRQYQIKDGEEFTTNFYSEKDFIGNYISYQNQIPSQTTTEAIEACELVIIPFEKFEQFYNSIPATQESANIIGNRKLLEIHERNSSLLMDTPEERYYKLLEQKPELINRVPQYLIAQYLGIRPESLSRIRKRHGS